MRIPFIVCILLATVATSKAHAWGDEGHQTVCEIAYRLMNDKARAEVQRLLGAIPDRDKEQVLDRVKVSSDGQFLFNMSCTWADEFKYGGGYDKYSSWHYVNVPRDAKKVTSGDCSRKCVAFAVIEFARKLQKEDSSDWEKLKALMFLGHMVGDIHQPMHAGFADDQGGNKTIVRSAPDGCRKMHRIWDTCMIRDSGRTWSELADELMNELDMDYARRTHQIKPYDWATESLRIARLEQVQYCTLSGETCKRINPDRGRPSYKLDEDYLDRNISHVKNRLTQAGVRLASVLNQILGS